MPERVVPDVHASERGGGVVTFNRAVWDGEQPLVEHTPDLTAGPTPAKGDYVLPADAEHADGSSRFVGEGMVWQVDRWQDPHTGEVDDLLQVACNIDGRIEWGTIRAGEVGTRTRASVLDAAGLVVLCARAVVKNGRKTSDNVKALFDVAWQVMRGGTPMPDVPSLLDGPVLHEDLAARLAASTSAHRARTHSRESHV